MTNREAYVMGWIYGLLTRLGINGKPEEACKRPYAGNTIAIQEACQKRLLSNEKDLQISEALGEIENFPDGKEEHQPLEKQGIWQRGYFAGKGGYPLSKSEFDIGVARRKKRITQSQLAELMGVDQALVSRWETGKIHPNERNIQRLKDILLS